MHLRMSRNSLIAGNVAEEGQDEQAQTPAFLPHIMRK